MIRHTARTVSWLAVIASIPCAFGDTPQLTRPDDKTLVLRFGENVTDVKDVKVIVPEIGEYPASETHQKHLLTITIPDDAAASIRRRTAAHGHSTLYIGSLTLASPPKPAAKSAKAKPAPASVPQIDSAYLIPDVFTFATRQAAGSLLVLEVIYAPDLSRLSSAAAYTVQSDKLKYNVAHAEFQKGANGDPGRVYLQLDQTPRNGASLKIAFLPAAGQSVEAASLAAAAAPKATSTDPSGGADIYLAVNFTRNTQVNPSTPENVYGVNASLQHAFWLSALSGDNNFLFLNPAFAAKLYSKGQDSENTMTLSAPIGIQTITRSLNPVIEQMIISAAPTYETDEKAHNRNLVADLEFTPLFVDQPFIHKNIARFRLKPFVGAELGHTFHNDFPQLDGAAVERFKTGASGELKFLVNQSFLKAVTLTAGYTYRHLFEKEVFMTSKTVQIPAGTLTTSGGQTINIPGGALSEQVFPTINASPRRYLDTTLLFGLTPNLSAQVEYTRGELPPAFQRVDKLQAGIAFLFNFRSK
jgi:hypothetical protein